MCIKDNFNQILLKGKRRQIIDFIDTNCKLDSENSCIFICGGCDYLAMLEDKLKELSGELLRCPHCNKLQELCDCPDLFYKDTNNSEEINKQYDLQSELNNLNYNIVTCGNCGQVFIHKIILNQETQ